MISHNKILITLASSTLLLPAAGNALSPPSLTIVIQQNEQYERTRPVFQPDTPSVTPSLTSSGFVKNITYRTLEQGKAVSISRANEEDIWMQEIRLSEGARLGSVLDVRSYNSETGEPQFAKKTLNEIRSEVYGTPFSIINGQFFNPRANPTELSFGLKSAGVIRSAGADNGQSKKNILIVGEKSAQIVPYSWENLRDATGDFAIVNLTLDTNHYASSNIGRTYICIKNPDAENRGDTLLIFTALSMNERNMRNELIRQGCTLNSSAKLDSSGSSMLWYAGETIYGVAHKGDPDKRRIPHAITIYDAK